MSTSHILRGGGVKAPHSYGDCYEIWEPLPPVNFRACPGLYRDSLLSYLLSLEVFKFVFGKEDLPFKIQGNTAYVVKATFRYKLRRVTRKE